MRTLLIMLCAASTAAAQSTDPKVIVAQLDSEFQAAQKINDAATYEEPHQLAAGMNDIIVNGEVARRDGTFTTALAGRVLRPERQ